MPIFASHPLASRIASRLFCCLVLACLFQVSFGQENPKREIRGVWIATVKNIDWPSSSDLSTGLQQHELIRMLDLFKSSGINTLYFQVRSAADALYANSREPWAEWLSGKQGTGPSPMYDPLTFIITEAHRRAMEIHAWINPYRAVFDNKASSLVEDHISRVHKDWVFSYGGKTLFNPGIPAVRSYIVSVVMDIVEHYDVDGIHLDDYFYPYPVKGQIITDLATFQLYGSSTQTIENWRRENVNELIKQLGQQIKRIKPYVKFGVSPFGVWKNAYQDSLGSATSGGSSYLAQYADSRQWIQKGWVDYLVPQIYFSEENDRVPFDKLAGWWNANRFSRQVYIGLGPYRIGENIPGWKSPTQIPQQIRASRALKTIQGFVFFSARSFLLNELGFADSLKNHYFSTPALPPVMAWIDSIAPGPPQQPVLTADAQGVQLHWTAPKMILEKDKNLYYLIYRFSKGEPIDFNHAAHILRVVYNETWWVDSSRQPGKAYTYVITACDRSWNESLGSIPVSVPPL